MDKRKNGLIKLKANKTINNGGESGIWTQDTIARIHTFQVCALNRE